MSEMNFMDVFLEHENLLLNFDKDDMKSKKIEKDVSTNIHLK